MLICHSSHHHCVLGGSLDTPAGFLRNSVGEARAGIDLDFDDDAIQVDDGAGICEQTWRLYCVCRFERAGEIWTERIDCNVSRSYEGRHTQEVLI